MSRSNHLRDLLERLTLLLRADDRRGTDLLPTHRALLRYVGRANRYSDTPGAAALYLHQTKGTVSQSLNVLVRRNLVKKVTDSADRRVVRLRLTARGERALASGPDRADAALGRLTGAEAAVVQRAMGLLLDGLQGAAGGPTFGTCISCRWFQAETAGPRCGLTRDALESRETDRLCVEFDALPGEP